MPGNFTCSVCGGSISSDFVFQDGKRRCPKCAAMYFHGALDRMEDEADGKPADESRAATNTAMEENCAICAGSGTREDDDGASCANCDGTGKVAVRR